MSALDDIREFLATRGCDVSGPHGSPEALLEAAEERLRRLGDGDPPSDRERLARLVDAARGEARP